MNPRNETGRNPGGGLDIRFYGRARRRAGVNEELLAAPLDSDLVRNVIEGLIDPSLVPFESGYSCGCPDHLLPFIVDRALRLLAQEHERCLDCEVADWIDPYEAWEGRFQHVRASGVDSQIDILTEMLSSRSELFFDFLCALVQGHDVADYSSLYDQPAGTSSNATVKASLERNLNKILRYTGWQLVDGFPLPLFAELTAPAQETSWPEVQLRLDEATREILEQRYGNAVTDIGTALQVALTLAGCPGKVLSDQLKTARNKDLFRREHTKLGLAAESLAEWISSMRNQKADAHPGVDASESESLLALRVVTAMTKYLLDDTGSEAPTED